MSDVQDLAPSHGGQETEPSGDSRAPGGAISPLMQYLIHGRGWLILNAMNTLAGQVSFIILAGDET